MTATLHVIESPRVRTRVRLTRRGRAVLIALIVLPVIAALVWAGLNGGVAVATDQSPASSLTYVTVNADESLWDIAQREAPGADTRAYVDAVISLNHLSSDIQPGQRLALPVVG